jgi:hypothetical protein
MSSNQSKDAQAKAEASFKRKAEQQRDGKVAMAEYEAAGRAMRERTAKLRELRLAKEAAEAQAEAAKPKPEPKVKSAPVAKAKPAAKGAVKDKKKK